MNMQLYSIFFTFLFLFIQTGLEVSLSSALAPQNVLELLMKGNERYVQDKSEHPNRSIERRQSISSKQEPFAIIVGCSDSRVAPEIIFDQGIGDLFVVRVAGNVIGPIELESIEYAAEYLHASLILVLGHENCGAVNAVLSGQTEDIESIAAKVEKAMKENKIAYSTNPVENAVKANVNWAIRELNKNELIQELRKKKKLALAGGYYHLESGKVELCCMEGIDK